MKITELQEGVEYCMIYKGKKQPDKYQINDGLLEVGVRHYGWKKSQFGYNAVLEADFEPCEWVPKNGDVYYYPNFSKQLVGASNWAGFENELAIKRNVGVYRTREEAIAKVKELGWT
jgi:hypothetical protein